MTEFKEQHIRNVYDLAAAWSVNMTGWPLMIDQNSVVAIAKAISEVKKTWLDSGDPRTTPLASKQHKRADTVRHGSWQLICANKLREGPHPSANAGGIQMNFLSA